MRGGEFTVFAPTDEAFATALEALGLTAEELLADTETLTSILTYHVVEGTVTSDMLEAGEVTTVNGAPITISLEDGVTVNDATVVAADVTASNGVIHVIDTVLLPPAEEAMEDMATEEPMAEETEEAMEDMATEEPMTDMDEMDVETATYEGANYSFDYPSNFEVTEGSDLVRLTDGDSVIVVVGPDSYNTVLGDVEFEDESEAFAFYLDRTGYTVGDEGMMAMGVASYEIELPRRGQFGDATLVDLDNGRRGVIIELGPDADSAPNAEGAVVGNSWVYPADIVDVAISTEGFSTLVAAVQAAGLEDTLRGGEFTVFAPTDEAFATALEALGLTAEELLADTETLTSILTYHVVEGTVTSDMLEAGEVTTVNGAPITISLEDGVTVNDATVVAADVTASNGVIHVIDTVLLPPADEAEEPAEEGEGDAEGETETETADAETEEPTLTIVGLAIGNEDLSTLANAVVRAGLMGTLNGEGEFTVFAPTNEAFAAALEELGVTFDDLIADQELLESILLYHVVEGTVTSDMLEAGEVTTLNGATVTIALEDGVTVNGANVVAADVMASNGVVHVIDAVLVPPSGE